MEGSPRQCGTPFYTPRDKHSAARNLWHLRALCQQYAGKPKLQSLIAEISWAKNLLSLARCKDDLPSPEDIAERLKGWAGEIQGDEGDENEA